MLVLTILLCVGLCLARPSGDGTNDISEQSAQLQAQLRQAEQNWEDFLGRFSQSESMIQEINNQAQQWLLQQEEISRNLTQEVENLEQQVQSSGQNMNTRLQNELEIAQDRLRQFKESTELQQRRLQEELEIAEQQLQAAKADTEVQLQIAREFSNNSSRLSVDELEDAIGDLENNWNEIQNRASGVIQSFQQKFRDMQQQLRRFAERAKEALLNFWNDARTRFNNLLQTVNNNIRQYLDNVQEQNRELP